MGGMALGKGVDRSGLLEVLGTLIRDLVGGSQLYHVVLILSPIVLVSNLVLALVLKCLPVFLPATDHIDLHLTYNRERSPGSDRKGSWKKSARSTTKSPHFHYCAHLFCRHGYAGIRVPESNCVRWPIFHFQFSTELRVFSFS